MYPTFWAGLVPMSLPGITEILEESIHGARALRMPASSLPSFPFVLKLGAPGPLLIVAT